MKTLETKRLKKLALLLVAAFVLLSAKCNDGPDVDICISSPLLGAFVCVGKDEKEYELPFEKTDSYICMSPEDMEQVVNYCGLKTQGFFSE